MRKNTNQKKLRVWTLFAQCTSQRDYGVIRSIGRVFISFYHHLYNTLHNIEESFKDIVSCIILLPSLGCDAEIIIIVTND